MPLGFVNAFAVRHARRLIEFVAPEARRRVGTVLEPDDGLRRDHEVSYA
jgi:hypothetical protein